MSAAVALAERGEVARRLGGPEAPVVAPSERERLDAFARDVRALEDELRAGMGSADVAHLERLCAWRDKGLRWGRALTAIGFDPITFGLGCALLSMSKLLSVGPLGHDIYHGAWDKVPGAERFASETWAWDAPIDKEIWLTMHNRRHHPHTGKAEVDADGHFVFARVNPHVGRDALTRWQLLIAVLSLGAFTHLAHMQYMGVFDAFADRVLRRPRVHAEVLTTRQALGRWWRSVRGYAKRHYLVGPLWWGPLAPKVWLGEWIAGRVRDLALFYFGFATHAGEDSRWFPEGHRSGSRGAWLRDQVAVTYNTRLPEWMSTVLDAVDFHIEHHVFHRLPSHLYRVAAPRLRAICEEHGVPYRVEPVGRRIWTTFREFWRLR